MRTRPRVVFIFEHAQYWDVHGKNETHPLGRAHLCYPSAGLRSIAVALPFWRFTTALRSGVTAPRSSSRIDFPAVRASLQKQLVARSLAQRLLHKRWGSLGPSLIDMIVDTYGTPEGIAALLSNPGALKSLQTPRQFKFSTSKGEDWSKIKYASSQGHAVFVVEREGIKIRFRFKDLSWQLNDLDLVWASRRLINSPNNQDAVALHESRTQFRPREADHALRRAEQKFANLPSLFSKAESKMFRGNNN